MATKLLELWIISKSGLAFVHHNPKGNREEMDSYKHIFSGFLSAVESIAAEKIDAINMSDSKILIIPVKHATVPPFFVVGRAGVKERDKNIRKQLFKIRDEFLSEFGEFIISWSGDATPFEFFEKKISDIYF